MVLKIHPYIQIGLQVPVDDHSYPYTTHMCKIVDLGIYRILTLLLIIVKEVFMGSDPFVDANKKD